MSTKPYKATVYLKYRPARPETSNFATYAEAVAFAIEEAKWENTLKVFVPADPIHESFTLIGDFA